MTFTSHKMDNFLNCKLNDTLIFKETSRRLRVHHETNVYLVDFTEDFIGQMRFTKNGLIFIHNEEVLRPSVTEITESYQDNIVECISQGNMSLEEFVELFNSAQRVDYIASKLYIGGFKYNIDVLYNIFDNPVIFPYAVLITEKDEEKGFTPLRQIHCEKGIVTGSLVVNQKNIFYPILKATSYENTGTIHKQSVPKELDNSKEIVAPPQYIIRCEPVQSHMDCIIC